MRFLRDNSLTLVLLLFFALSILGHALTGWRVETAEALRHGQGGGTLMEYLGSAPFQRESPESKPVSAPHDHTGD